MSKEFIATIVLIFLLAGGFFYFTRPSNDSGLSAEEEAKLATRLGSIKKKSTAPAPIAASPDAAPVDPAAANPAGVPPPAAVPAEAPATGATTAPAEAAPAHQ